MSSGHPENGNNKALGSHLSWSAIRTFRTCPLQYFFKYKACLPQESISPNLVFGAAIHRALEVHFSGWLQLGQPPAMDELLDAFWAEFRARQLKERDLDGDEQASLTSQHGTAQRLLELFRNSRFARPAGRILAVEESFRAQIIDRAPDFHGIVDLVVEMPQEIVVYDWKTARARWSATDRAGARVTARVW